MPVQLTPRAKLLLPVCIVALAGLSLWRLNPTVSVVTFRGETMGTTYQVNVVAASQASEIEGELKRQLLRIDSLMSTYRDDSEVSRFNSQRGIAPFPVSVLTARVVSASQDLSQRSDGAFDVTVRPLVAAWGFGAGAKTSEPSSAELESARARVGYRRLHVTLGDGEASIQKDIADLEIDLSAVAKGLAVDVLAQVLEAKGLSDYMVEVGGELRISGTKPGGELWRIGVERPDSSEREIQRVLKLRNTGMATSGDYRNYYERDGKRVSHTIDPRTGRPIEHALASVTVLHPEAMRADAWATALNVLGPDAGLELAQQQELAAYFIVREKDGQFRTVETPRFSELTAGP